ncbi:MAG: peptide chain release factor aRF-1 [Candidatus Aenigmatarchaeota archaeon]
MEEEKIKLKKIIKELENVRGRRTELISYYLPPNYDINAAINQIAAEISTAKNIKSDQTRNNVLDALDKIANALKNIRKIGPNGLAIFCGNVSQQEGRTDIRIWIIEPPEPLNVKLYHCDQEFVLEPLKELLKEKDVYGLIVLDAKEATIGILRGKNIIPVFNKESDVPSKTSKGGWSQQRYKRIREQALDEWLKKIGEKASQIFLQENVKGIIIGGPGPTKEEFVNGDYLDYRLKNKVIAVKDVGYTDEYGLEELVKRSQDVLQEASITKEKNILNDFFAKIAKNENVVYGYSNTIKYLESGALEKLLISEDFDFGKIKLKCNNCGYEKEVEGYLSRIDKTCDNCKAQMEVISFENYDEKIVESANSFGTEVIFISTSTPEGKQFYNLGAIGGFARFRLD